MEARRTWNFDISGERDSLPSSIPAMQYFDMSDDNASASQIVEGRGGESRRLSYFGRLNYDYKGKYLFTTNLRRDGVHNLAKDKRFGYFPSVSVGWKFSEEAFMQNQTLISFGKIRYGYGQAGNFPGGETSYPYLSIVRKPNFFGYSFDNSNVSSVGAAPVQIENPGLGWETVHMSNFGIDLTFLQNRLSFTAEYYKKINEDMIMLNEVPYIAGSQTYGPDFDIDNTNPLVNIGSIQNSGFEFTLGYKITEGDLKGSFDLNFATLKNEVLELATDSMQRGSVHNVNPITMTVEGRSISEFWGWEIDGIFRSEEQVLQHVNDEGELLQEFAVPGDARFRDVNGDGEVLTDDDKVFLGSPLPKFVFGFSINLEYKGFDFSAFFNGTYGNKIFNGTKQYLYYYQEWNNKASDYSNRYIAEDIYKYNPLTGQEELIVEANTETDLFRDASTNYTKPTDFYIEDASYIRLRNLILGYTIPSEVTNVINVEKLRFYVGARNLLTITKYGGLNPEAAYSTESGEDSENRQNLDMGIDVGAYPLAKMLLFGVNLTF
jgi:TonB-linked SusC/RagA family outer membrane protein